MVSLRRPPTFIPGIPSFQPAITGVQLPDCWAVETRIAQSGWPRPGSRLESNLLPLLASQPVYCTLTVAPLGAVAPSPTFRSTIWSPSGNLIGVLPAPSLKSSAPAAGVGVV